MNIENERITTAGICFLDNKVLIGHRIDKGSIGGTWEFPGGKNRWGETPEETLKREFIEELNLKINVFEQIATFDFTNKGTLYHLKAFRVELIDTKPIFDLSVHTEVKWELLENLDKYDFAPSDGEIIKQIRRDNELTR